MAVRSGAGTGVVVSLVVFVLTTVFLLVLTIVFYAGKTKEMEAKATVEATLEQYIKRNEQSLDTYKNIKAAASNNRESVARFLNEQLQEVMQLASGNGSQSIDALKTQMSNYGIEDGQTIIGALQDKTRALTTAQNQLATAQGQLQGMQDRLAEKDAQIAAAEQAHQGELDNLRDEYQGYRDAAQQYATDIQEVVDEYNDAKQRLEDQYENRLLALQNELDASREQHVLDMARIDSLEEKISSERINPPDPALLKDGEVMLVMASDRTVSINRGSKDHISLGMTFEVFDDVNAVLASAQTGGRGKAQLRVIGVEDRVSKCKIVFEATGRPVIRGDIIVNAVYDPNYAYKFLVHGSFDLDEDGRPTTTDADYIRGLIKDWGGAVVYGDTIPGDLDFLVLGIQPPNPPQPAQDAPPHVWEVWSLQRQAYEQYNLLLRQATDAQIPVLNANRFRVLTGQTGM